MVSENCSPSSRPPGWTASIEPPSVRFYPEPYGAIREACARLLLDPGDSAKSTLAGFALRYVDQATPNPELLSHLVAEALLQRFDSGLVENSNVYVQHLEHSQTTLFYLMAEAVPFVEASHQIANRYLLDGLGDARRATLFELGTGRGLQIAKLLDAVAEQKPRLEALDIVGIDPVEDNLSATERMFGELRARLPFAIRFRPVHALIERVSLTELRALAGADPGALVINSAFTFHHTRHALHDDRARTALLRRLARLRPAVFTLAEPSADHDTEDLLLRLYHSWEHFSHLFELVDESSLGCRQRLAIKAHFFGREIRDLFAVDDHYRCERHEPWYSWRARLRDAGLSPRPLEGLELELGGSCSFDSSKHCVRLLYRGKVMAAVLGHGS